MIVSPPEENLEDFLENSLSGHISATSKGEIIWVNRKIAEWLDIEIDQLIGKRITNILSVGSRIFYETHLSPMLKLTGFFEEVAAELQSRNGTKMQVLINGYTKKDEHDKSNGVWLNLYRATQRTVYEDNLRMAVSDAEKTLKAEREMALLREQFIAVLGHDLRNPLGAIKAGSTLLNRSPLSDRDKAIVGTITKSSLRMEEMIANVLDFARVRLGGGIMLELDNVMIEPVIDHIITELVISFPGRTVVADLDVPIAVKCDMSRLSQMLSNLLANALSHGSSDEPVRIMARINDNNLEIAVINGGKPIPEKVLQTLFEPFTREANTPSQQGLGLGLYIASQIAKAHGGTLTAKSNLDKTFFTFKMPHFID